MENRSKAIAGKRNTRMRRIFVRIQGVPAGALQLM
jgi:hypothetical protein